jgi:hypothetical protein
MHAHAPARRYVSTGCMHVSLVISPRLLLSWVSALKTNPHPTQMCALRKLMSPPSYAPDDSSKIVRSVRHGRGVTGPVALAGGVPLPPPPASPHHSMHCTHLQCPDKYSPPCGLGRQCHSKSTLSHPCSRVPGPQHRFVACVASLHCWGSTGCRLCRSSQGRARSPA